MECFFFFLWEFELQNFKRYIDNCTKSVCGVYERNLFLLWKVAYFWMQSVGCIFFKKVAFKRNVLKQTFDVVNGLTTHHAFRCQKSPENSSMQPLETYVFWLLSDYLPCGLLARLLTSLHQLLYPCIFYNRVALAVNTARARAFFFSALKGIPLFPTRIPVTLTFPVSSRAQAGRLSSYSPFYFIFWVWCCTVNLFSCQVGALTVQLLRMIRCFFLITFLARRRQFVFRVRGCRP
jgi:hypothetical protein